MEISLSLSAVDNVAAVSFTLLAMTTSAEAILGATSSGEVVSKSVSSWGTDKALIRTQGGMVARSRNTIFNRDDDIENLLREDWRKRGLRAAVT
jgi:hypothetical protein